MQATAGDAGYDLKAAESVSMAPGTRALIKTGLRLAIPPGYVGMVCSRSGLALKHGVFVLNAPGIVDPGYRGDVGVLLYNGGDRWFDINPGDRIAQLLFAKVEHPAMMFGLIDVAETERGAGGFGHTGVAS